MSHPFRLKCLMKRLTTSALCCAFAAAPRAALAQERYHTVQAGETLSGILYRYGLKDLYGKSGKVVKAAELNSRTVLNIDIIRPGQKLRLPIEARKLASRTDRRRETVITSARFLTSSTTITEPVISAEPPARLLHDPVPPHARAVAASLEVAQQPEVDTSTPKFKRHSAVEVGAGAAFFSFEGRQISNGSRGKLLSGLSPSLSLTWKQHWNETTSSHVGLKLASIRLQGERSEIELSNAAFMNSAFDFGVGKTLADTLGVSLIGGIENAVFYRGKVSGGLEIFQTPVFTLKPQARVSLLKLEPFVLLLKGGATYYGSSSYDGAVIKSGLGVNGSIGLEQEFLLSQIGCEFGYSTRRQDTQFLEFNQKEIGLSCALKWSL
jgi:LysM domain